ncbi:DUF1289 domain-containing protein [Sphingomonas desiccabilis]|uniref:DUF1289 domain-containing protein n=1 Tax=Sphingomonas desiccabilis TaxID=429134 RepID=A0A4Q2IXS8_9SPHN|nr:DUF1289 domain-containing protein [Sphingomonas desiccabilis]
MEYVAPVAVESPCVLVCTLDLESGWCFGCGRTREEIADWTRMSADERNSVMAVLPERCGALERRIAASIR